MSVHLTSLVWEIDFPTHTQKLIMLRVADYANDDGEMIFPSVRHLANSANSTRRTTQYALSALEKIELMRKTHIGGGGPKDTNQWSLNVELLCQLAGQEMQLEGKFDCVQVVEKKGANLAPLDLTRVQRAILRVQSTTIKGAVGSTQSLKRNHQLEPNARERAKIDDLNLKSKESPPTPQPSITLTTSSLGWSAWIGHLRANGNVKLADQAEEVCEMVAASKWPKPDSPLPRISSPKNLTAQSKRVTGEHVE